MRKSMRKRSVVLGVAIIAVLLLLAIAYLSRGWLRSTAIPWVASTIYAPKIDRAFEENIEPVNTILKPYSIPFNYTGNNDDGSAGCTDAMFHHFQETVYCARYHDAQVIDVSPELRNDWVRVSKDIKKVLKDKNWQIDKSDIHESPVYTEDLSRLLFAKEGIAFATYTKQIGKVYCTLDFKYDTGDGEYEPYISIYEECTRNLKIFGGYEY